MRLIDDVEATLEDGKRHRSSRAARRKRGAHDVGHDPRRSSTTWSRACPPASPVNLEINGVGYRAAVQGNNLMLQLGYSHDVVFPIPADIKIDCERPTAISVTGADKQRVGQVAAEIRGFRKPEPYKGKGIKYATRRSCARKARRSRAMASMSENSRAAGASALRYQLRQKAARPAPTFGVPLVAAYLCPGHRRRGGHDARRRIDPRQGPEGGAEDRRRYRRRRAVGKLIAERAMAAGVTAGRVRPRRLSVPWPGQGPGRRRPRGRSVFLGEAEYGTHERGGEATGAAATAATASGGGDREESELVEKLVGINRVAKVVKGGRRFGFAALVVVGDRKGRVGYGSGKAREVPEAIRKATDQAKRNMIRVPLREGRTLHHDVPATTAPARWSLRAARRYRHHRRRSDARDLRGAGRPGCRREVDRHLQSAQYDQGDLRRAHAVVSPRAVAARRGKKVSDIIGRRERRAEAKETPAWPTTPRQTVT